MIIIKKIIRAFNNLLVYQKMIIIFTVMLLFLYSISLALTSYGKNVIGNQYQDSVKSKIKFYGEILDNHIFFIRTRQLQLFSDSDVQKLNFLGNLATGYEEVELVNGIREELYMVNNSSDLIDHNGIIIDPYDHVISNDKGWKPYNNGIWNEIKLAIMKGDNRVLFHIEDQLYLIAMDNSENIISYIQISKNKLMDTITNIVEGHKDSGVFLVDNKTAEKVMDKNVDQSLMSSILKEETNFDLSNGSHGEEDGYRSFIINSNQNEYQISSFDIKSLDMTLYTYMNQKEVTENISYLSRGFLILTIISFLIFVMFAWFVNYMIHKPLNKLVLLFQNHQEGNKEQRVMQEQNKGEFSYLYHNFHKMADRLDRSIKENYQQKLAIQKSELKQLQSQINPHFLYNSFYNIYRLSKMNDHKQVSLLSQKLASYYQFITKSGSDEVAFEKEYKHALDYCVIQSIRFSNRINFSASELDGEIKHILVPRLIIQPVIENVFEHAFEDIEYGELKIDVTYENNILIVTVEDNGDQLTNEQLINLQNRLSNPKNESETTGILNVSSRLKIRYGKESGLFASRSSLGGMKVEIRINLEEE